MFLFIEGHLLTCMPEEETTATIFIAFNMVSVFPLSQGKSGMIPKSGEDLRFFHATL